MASESDSLGLVGDSDLAPKRRLRLVAEAADFVIDCAPGTTNWYAWNKLTGERTALAGGSQNRWGVATDEAHNRVFFYMTAPGVDEVSGWRMEYFLHHRYKTVDGDGEYVRMFGRGCPPPFDAALRQRRFYAFGVFVGSTNAQANIDIAIFDLAQDGHRFWFRWEAIYEGAGLWHIVKRSSNRWLHVNLPTWEWLHRLSLRGMVRRSKQLRPAAESDPDDSRCLGWFVVTPAACFALLCRLCCTPRCQSGFKDPLASEGTLDFMKALLKRLGGRFELHLFLDPTYEPPRYGFLQGANLVSVHVAADLKAKLWLLKAKCVELLGGAIEEVGADTMTMVSTLHDR